MKDDRTTGQKVADKIAEFGGSWAFIITFFSSLCCWMMYNSKYLSTETFDPYPFILLNLVLSCLAAIQAPIIMMSQNRQAEKDRKKADKDLNLSIDMDKELKILNNKIDYLKVLIKKMEKEKPDTL